MCQQLARIATEMKVMQFRARRYPYLSRVFDDPWRPRVFRDPCAHSVSQTLLSEVILGIELDCAAKISQSFYVFPPSNAAFPFFR